MRRRRERIVVVGAGLAGLRAAERLRELGFSGELVIVGAETHPPYHRPALSKHFLTGDLDARDLTLPSYVPLNARWRLGTTVARLDPSRRVLHLFGGEQLRYDGLVIATGVGERHISGVPRRDPRVHTLRTLDDALALQRTLTATDGKVVVVGGGFTGCELASTLRELGRDVAIVSRSDVLLGRVFGAEMGEALGKLHEARGVSLSVGVEVQNWMTGDQDVGLHLSDGTMLVADCVVLAVGNRPAIDWLRGSGLHLPDGVLCGPTCHVVGAQDIVAAGDVACWPNLRFDRTPRRVEHWLNAVEMGRAAAANLIAGPSSAQPFTPLPRFWSEQHGVRLQAAGMPTLGHDTVPLSGNPVRDRGVLGYTNFGNLVGLVGRENPREVLRWTAELERHTQGHVDATTIRAVGAARRRQWTSWQRSRRRGDRPRPALRAG